jgi:hypothetical protein
VTVEIEPYALAGQVSMGRYGTAPEMIPNSKTQDKIALDEPEAKIMSVIWDTQFATEVVGVTTANRGTYLNFTANGDAIHPVMLVFKSLENYKFETDRLVADIRGGEELAGGEKDKPLLTPGQYALIDDEGQIIVRTEFDDWDSFRKLALPEAIDPMQSGTMMGGEGDMLDGGEGMMPGGGPAGRRGGRRGS